MFYSSFIPQPLTFYDGLTLIGYRGTGKKSVAPTAGHAPGIQRLDADAEIERRAGRTIREIFADEGEPGFRAREHDLDGRVLGTDQLVIAAGGGAILDHRDAAPSLRQAGPVVWLRARIETIERQIAADPTTRERRPNLMAGGGRPEIESLLAVREPLYRETASLTVDVDGRPLDEMTPRSPPRCLPICPRRRTPPGVRSRNAIRYSLGVSDSVPVGPSGRRSAASSTSASYRLPKHEHLFEQLRGIWSPLRTARAVVGDFG